MLFTCRYCIDNLKHVAIGFTVFIIAAVLGEAFKENDSKLNPYHEVSDNYICSTGLTLNDR